MKKKNDEKALIEDGDFTLEELEDFLGYYQIKDTEELKLRDINLSAHSLRKTFAYRVWLENGKDIFFVKYLLVYSTVE